MKFDLVNALVRFVMTIVLSMAYSALPAAETEDKFDADSILKYNRPWLHPEPKQLHAGCVPPEQIALAGVHPFELGKQAVLPKPDTQKPSPVQSVHFTLRLRARFFEMGDHPDLIAEIGLPQASPLPNSDERLLLTLLDKSGYPIRAVRAPLADLSTRDRTFDDMVQAVRSHNALWLAPKAEKYPGLTYDFINDKRHPVTVTQASDSYLHRGVTMWLDWDNFLAQPQQYHAPVQFDAVLDGKPVIVAAVSGPCSGLRWGYGLEGVTGGYTGGYTVTTASHGLVVIDKETWRPLVSRYGDNEFHFLDYVEVKPGMHAPLRIVVLNGESRYDFHFQVIDGRAWLFDRSCGKGKVWARAEVKTIEDGSPAKVTARLPEDAPPVEHLKPLDWSRIVQRASVHQPELPLVQKIIACDRPWEHPDYESVLATRLVAGKNADGPLLVIDFGRSWVLSDVRYWTLTRLAPDQPPWPLPGPKTFKVPVFPFQPGESMPVDIPAGAMGTSGKGGGVRILSCQMKPEAGDIRATLEILGEAQNRGLYVPIAIALLDQDGTIVSADSADVRMIIREGIISCGQTLALPLSDAKPKYVLFGLKSLVTSQPMGSFMGLVHANTTRRIPSINFLSAEDANVWQYGVKRYSTGMWSNGCDCARMMRRSQLTKRRIPILEILAPHLDSFERLLKAHGQPEALAIVARLAGYSGDERFHDTLAGLLGHPARGSSGCGGDRPRTIRRRRRASTQLRAVLTRPVPGRRSRRRPGGKKNAVRQMRPSRWRGLARNRQHSCSAMSCWKNSARFTNGRPSTVRNARRSLPACRSDSRALRQERGSASVALFCSCARLGQDRSQV